MTRSSPTRLPWEVVGRQLSPGGTTTDVNGSIVFRGTLDEGELAFSGIPAGDGYRVRYVEDGNAITSAPFEVLDASGASTPDRSFHDDQVLGDGFGYIETRDGTLLSATELPGCAPSETGEGFTAVRAQPCRVSSAG